MLNHEQRIATYPHHSVWVSASAGTGKTKVLTDRTLRLLLEGVQPEKILCITFTNAAASEMLMRIQKELLKWHDATNHELNSILCTLLGKAPSNDETIKARKLYTEINHDNAQLNIQTIHAFCQSILAKFPLEVGIKPNAQVVDELERSNIVRYIMQNMTISNPHESTLYLLAHLHQVTFNELINNILSNAIKFQYFLDSQQSNEWYHSTLRNLLQLPYKKDPDGVYTLATKEVQKLFMHYKIPETAPEALHNIEHSEAFYKNILRPIFITKSGKARAKLLSKKNAEQYPELLEILLSAQQIILDSEDKIKSYAILEYTTHLISFIRDFLTRYTNYKQKNALLDYDDLIYKTAEFLQQGTQKQWVLYKLDGGIEHILVDEAQDTSNYQWQIIESLISELYSGENNEKQRSLFVVGDSKQSIYSFQGADIDIYNNMKKSIGPKLRLGGNAFQYIDLLTSYRSSQTILDLVYQTFLPIKNLHYTNIACHRTDAIGSVQLWDFPSQQFTTQNEKKFWSTNNDNTTPDQRSRAIAQKIARHIKQQVDDKVILSKTGKAAEYGDFMILIRKRGKLSHILASELTATEVQVAGLDRIDLQSSQIIANLIIISKFILQPLDNHNLAQLLISPIFHFSQVELHQLLTNKAPNCSLWEYIQSLKLPCALELQNLLTLHYQLDLKAFYKHILNIFDYKTRLLNAINDEGTEIIEYFFNILTLYLEKNSCNIHAFILWLENSDLEIKRDLSKINKVKIMTVHGAKGLEAPVVILPETNDIPRGKKQFILAEKLFVAAKNKSHFNKFYQKLTDEIKDKQYQEYLRLLYVALTRAQDHLIICGDSSNKKQDYASWFHLLESHIDNKHIIHEEVHNTKISEEVTTKPIQYKLHTNAMQQIEEKNYANSNIYAVSYGQVAHKVLADIILTQGDIDITSHPLIYTLPDRQQKKAIEQLTNFINSDIFTNFKKYHANSEVPIGVKGQDGLFGRIDLLLENEEEIIIIDYKTDHNPAKTESEVSDEYKTQLLFYHQTMAKFYTEVKSHKKISSYILWLENLTMMQLFETKL